MTTATATTSPVAVRDPAMAYSASQFDLLLQCARRYHDRYVLRNREPETPEKIGGTVLARMTAFTLRAQTAGNTCEYAMLADLFADEWNAEIEVLP